MPAVYPPKPEIAAGAKVGSLEAYQELYRRSLEEPDAYWREQAERLDWLRPPERIDGSDMESVDFRWFEGGRLNACYNAVDRHAARTPERTALIWAEDEPGAYRRITYRELQQEVCRMANLLRERGVAKGDRVCIYLPMIPELAYAMLACARIGAVHSVVFAGFSAAALRDRILDAGCRILLTADEGHRGGKRIPLKAISDEALQGAPIVRDVLVARRGDGAVPMEAGRDRWLDEELARQRPYAPCEPMDAEDPLFVLYTSGSTGQPKGLLHTTGGYLCFAAMTHDLVFDLRPDDVYCCAADAGWITGHSYIVYGPLVNGATTVMFESTPLYPDPGRYWRLIEDLGVTIFYTAPTALRAVHGYEDDWVTRYDRSSLRILGTVGEPINPEVWAWYHDVVGEGRAAVVDTWWQTETGGIMISPLPGATPAKPGSATLPLPGVALEIVDDEGRPLEGGDVRGRLCITRPWPGMARTIWRDHARFRSTYFDLVPGRYFTGDGCRRDEDGYYWITGRVDDVLNVSGHRLGTAEIESALVAHDAVAEAAVVGVPHELKGQGIYAFVDLAEDLPEDVDVEALVAELRGQVRTIIGPIATPDAIQVVAGLPKTRSGKIMRRILRKVAAGDTEDLGDISTLADPSVVARLVAARAEV